MRIPEMDGFGTGKLRGSRQRYRVTTECMCYLPVFPPKLVRIGSVYCNNDRVEG